MKQLSILVGALLLCSSFMFAQTSPISTRMEPIPPLGTVHVADIGPGFDPEIRFLAPPPDGEGTQDLLREQKTALAEQFPRQTAGEARSGGAEPPILLIDFGANNSTSSTPMDNHLAVSNDGQIVSVINRHFQVKDPLGDTQGSATLNNLISDLNLDNLQFDPRILYDPDADRFIVFMMHGFGSTTSKTIIGFSQTADATGYWNFYQLDGNPFDNNTWSDYPIVAMTDTEVFVTLNLLENNSSWQEGFTESIIWQIGKAEGYAGQPLETMLWSGINFGDAPIRNLCPVKAGDGQVGDNLYLLSNRNFDLENDSIFILELTGTMDDPNTELLIDVQKADIPYGLSPDALQPEGTLATNDARVLDAFIMDNTIQFVGNSVDHGTGQAAVYHGLIEDVTGDRTVTGFIVNGGVNDLGYPAIAYTGIEEGDQDAIIVASHSSPDRFPGCSALYFDNTRAHSELVTIKEGLDVINMLTGDPERWGDYAGNQRKYNEPGIVWVSASFGEANSDNDTWVGELARPDLLSGSEEPQLSATNVQVFPNPTADRLEVQFELPAETELLQIQIVDALGRTVKVFLDDHAKKTGLVSFSFSLAPLSGGLYFLQIRADDQIIHTERIVKE